MEMNLFKSVFDYPCGCTIEVISTDRSDILARPCTMHQNITLANYASVKQIETALCLDHENARIYSVEMWEGYISPKDSESSFSHFHLFRVYADGHIMSISPFISVHPRWRDCQETFQLVKCSCGFNSKRFLTLYKQRDEPVYNRSKKHKFDDFHESLYKLAVFG